MPVTRFYIPSQQILVRFCSRTPGQNISASQLSYLTPTTSLSRCEVFFGQSSPIKCSFFKQKSPSALFSTTKPALLWGRSSSIDSKKEKKQVKEHKYHEDDDVMPEEMSVPVEENMAHPIWPKNKLELVKIKHLRPERIVDRLALFSVKLLRTAFDITSGYAFGRINEAKWIRRIVFLETVAGVPGMMGAMVRHLNSLRKMKRDNGWIHTLLEEAENERMHLMVMLQLQQPGYLFRLGTLVTQGVFTNVFFLVYLMSSRFCHRFVGYLEEEAVVTYTKLLKDIDEGRMEKWKCEPAPLMAIRYWKLPGDATKRDMILAIRADEAHHRLVNHTLANIRPDERNPFAPKGD